MIYTRTTPVEFNHCDPAGIVFYPRYFEMTNSVVENFFAEALDWPFAAMMAAGSGVPTARLETTFHAPSRLGDRLDWGLSLSRLGRTAVDLALTAMMGGQVRVSVALTLVHVKAGRPAPWPDPVRARLTELKETDDA